MSPYASARNEFASVSTDNVYLDANENPFNNGLNRYPDPFQLQLKNRISELKGIPPAHIFLGNGSDEVLDLIIRAFCEPGKDNMVITPPTYGMYKVLAAINNVEIREASLNKDFGLDKATVIKAVNARTRILFLCSPNNPTGNSMDNVTIENILNDLNCIVVIDEAYIDFSGNESWINKLALYPNLIVCQTLSKAWGAAAIRLGICYASEPAISILNKIKPPYNISKLTQQEALKILSKTKKYRKNISVITTERDKLRSQLGKLPFVKNVYPSDANFLLIAVTNPFLLCEYLLNQGIVIRNRSNLTGCNNCVRITVGTPEENKILITKLKNFLYEKSTFYRP